MKPPANPLAGTLRAGRRLRKARRGLFVPKGLLPGVRGARRQRTIDRIVRPDEHPLSEPLAAHGIPTYDRQAQVAELARYGVPPTRPR